MPRTLSGTLTDSSLGPAVTGLLYDFQDAAEILSPSEAEARDVPLCDDPSLELVLNREDANLSQEYPYGSEETVSSIGEKLYGYQNGARGRKEGNEFEELMQNLLPLPLKGRMLVGDEEPEKYLEDLEENGECRLSELRGVKGDDIRSLFLRDPRPYYQRNTGSLPVSRYRKSFAQQITRTTSHPHRPIPGLSPPQCLHASELLSRSPNTQPEEYPAAGR